MLLQFNKDTVTPKKYYLLKEERCIFQTMFSVHLEKIQGVV